MTDAIILDESKAETTGIIDVNGKPYMADARGNLVPCETIKAADKLEDEQVRKIMGFARDLSDQIARFRGHTMTDLGELDALLEQDYGVTKGGKKGNRPYQTFDGLMQVKVQVSDFVDFGSQLQIAKQLIDECLNEWAADSRPEIRAIITRAFNTEKEGQVNRSEIFMLMRLDIEDARWQRAMDAIRDAMRVTGSREYVRFYERAEVTDGWKAVTIDLAKAGA
ncbi:MAG: sulfate transporter [Hoeflea sp.]|nr:sulfate transporter [Hoeflea sp.]